MRFSHRERENDQSVEGRRRVFLAEPLRRLRHLLRVGKECVVEVLRAGEVRRVRLDAPVVRGHARAS